MKTDDVHDADAGHFGYEGVVGQTGREHGAEGAGQNRRCRSFFTDARAQHDRNECRTDGSGAAGSRRNRYTNEIGDGGSRRNQHKAEFGKRCREQFDQMHVTLGHLNDKSKTHCRADCHDEARISHGFCKGVERLHRGEGNAG